MSLLIPLPFSIVGQTTEAAFCVSAAHGEPGHLCAGPEVEPGPGLHGGRVSVRRQHDGPGRDGPRDDTGPTAGGQRHHVQ